MILKIAAPVDLDTPASDILIRAVILAPPLRLDSGDWAFPIAASRSPDVVLGEVRVDERLMAPTQFAEHEEWWIEGVVEFVRNRNAAVDEDIAPGLVTIFAIEAERVGLEPDLSGRR